MHIALIVVVVVCLSRIFIISFSKMLQRPARVAAAAVAARSSSSAWWSISLAAGAGAAASAPAATHEVGESRTCTYLVVAERSGGSKQRSSSCSCSCSCCCCRSSSCLKRRGGCTPRLPRLTPPANANRSVSLTHLQAVLNGGVHNGGSAVPPGELQESLLQLVI